MLKVGSKAPDFELSDQHGELIRLVDLVSMGPLMLYFYPADFTPG
ncbi:MAG TPA: redoxin domain-containing protein [Gammaproteobacteria bacterium]|jgi:peroxiredoxin Q/BCP|nr:redoxin domain-containing protein [Gammaproteobacteria bacterium]HIK69452.1 redoxin domain-containing protein [Pseudomonadales bacterium]